jgi:thiosulfate/3-mercaptopyruvate sulfurtransferase
MLPPPIVDLAWLRAELVVDDAQGVRWHDRPVVLCDVRTTMTSPDPQEAFDEDHLPGARFVSLEDDLSAPPEPVDGRHPLPSPAAFAAALEVRGIGDDVLVLAIDGRGGAYAARLVWMLRLIGQPATYGDVTTVELTELVNEWARSGPIRSRDALPAGSRRIVAWPAGALADADAVVAHLAGGGVVVDSRDAARYRGEVEPIDAVAGHVPGAINLPFTHNLGPDGRLRPVGELAARFAEAGVDGAAIVYCGSGVTACHNALAVELAGRGRPVVYVGSWSGWTTEPGRAVATGADP